MKTKTEVLEDPAKEGTEKTYTLEELAGPEKKWRHVFPFKEGDTVGTISAGAVAYCGYVQPTTHAADAFWFSKRSSDLCPDCVRIAKARRGT